MNGTSDLGLLIASNRSVYSPLGFLKVVCTVIHVGTLTEQC